MGNILKNTLKNLSTRLLSIIFLGLIVVVIYFLTSNYYSQLVNVESKELMKLEGIAKTLSSQINGDSHELLCETFKEKDAIKVSSESSLYYKIHYNLKRAKEINSLETDIYIMVYDEDRDKFFYTVTSGLTPFYRHEYMQFPQVLKDNYKTGATIPAYETENGKWLSAFAPIKSKKGKTVAVVQLDQKFNVFIDEVNNKFFKHALISLIIIVIIAIALLRMIKTILLEEESIKQALILSNQTIEEKKKEIIDSINYAERIQTSLLPDKDCLNKFFSDSFLIFEPKDIVSGDIYWIKTKGDDIFFSVIDCTGHGVPGALVSAIAHYNINRCLMEFQLTETNEILDQLKKLIKEAFTSRDTAINDGMDLSLCRYNKKTKELQFSGANNPVILIQNNEVKELKACKQPIGNYIVNKSFACEKIILNVGDLLYMTSDGYADQFGGEKGKKFKTKNLKQLLLKISDQNMTTQMEMLQRNFDEWKGNLEQLDDVCVLGIRV